MYGCDALSTCKEVGVNLRSCSCQQGYVPASVLLVGNQKFGGCWGKFIFHPNFLSDLPFLPRDALPPFLSLHPLLPSASLTTHPLPSPFSFLRSRSPLSVLHSPFSFLRSPFPFPRSFPDLSPVSVGLT
jgi:hypothetical protein